MDVRNQPTHNAANAFTQLNRQTGLTGGSAAWGDALNHAISNRAGSATDPGINSAMQTFQQFASRQTNLNTRLRTQPTADAFNAAHDASTTQSPQDRVLEQKATTLVNQFFMGTMLKQMRDSPFKSDMFSGGRAGEAYAGLFDTQLSEHAGNRMAHGLVQAMVKAYRKNRTPTNTDSGLPIHAAA